MQREVGLGLGHLAPVPGLAGAAETRAVGERTARERLGRGELRIVVGDAGVHVEGDLDALGLRPRQERLRVGEQRQVPLPAVPLVGGLPVRVHGQGVERDVVGAERGNERVLVVRGGVGVVVGVPDSEVGLVEQRRRAGEPVQVAQRLAVVIAVDEQVPILDVTVGGPGLHPAVRGPDSALRVVEQPIPGPVEDARVHLGQCRGALAGRRGAGRAAVPRPVGGRVESPGVTA